MGNWVSVADIQDIVSCCQHCAISLKQIHLPSINLDLFDPSIRLNSVATSGLLHFTVFFWIAQHFFDSHSCFPLSHCSMEVDAPSHPDCSSFPLLSHYAERLTTHCELDSTFCSFSVCHRTWILTDRKSQSSSWPRNFTAALGGRLKYHLWKISSSHDKLKSICGSVLFPWNELILWWFWHIYKSKCWSPIWLQSLVWFHNFSWNTKISGMQSFFLWKVFPPILILNFHFKMSFQRFLKQVILPLTLTNVLLTLSDY